MNESYRWVRSGGHGFGWHVVLVAIFLLTGLTAGCATNPFELLRRQPPEQSPVAAACPLPAGYDEKSFFQADLRPEFSGDAQVSSSMTRYIMALRLDTHDPPTLAGTQTAIYTNSETDVLDRVVFRLYPNLPYFGGVTRVTEVKVGGRPVEARMYLDGSALEVPLAEPLAPGETVSIDMAFDVEIPGDNTAGYGQFAFMNEVFSLPNFYPTIPVYDDEGWNAEVSPSYGDVTFSDAAFYRVCLTLPYSMTVASSGVVVDVPDTDASSNTWVLEAGPMRDFALFLSRDFGVVEREVQGTSIRSFFIRGGEDGGRRALQYAADAFELYSRLFGPYPYTELDVVPTPNNAGGIEYPGVAVINQSLYSQASAEGVIAHEVAHQWWYGLVGSDQVDEPWLDEALASYSMYLYYEAVHGEEVATTVRDDMFVQPYDQAASTYGDRGAGGRVADYDAEEYYAFVYGEGPLFIDALRQEMGDDAFYEALQTYLQGHRYGVARSESFLEVFEEKGGPRVRTLYDEWIVGSEDD